jgi:Hint domain
MPCFTPGTMIATPKGEVQVEDLRAGDKIITREDGIQEIAWVGSRHLDWAALCANPHLKPVVIPQGSLGHGLPERDTLVSPNHRLLVTNDRTALFFEETEVLVAAKHLVSGRHIHAVDSAGTTYIHFMFDRHEVVLANGAWTESFQPADFTLKGIGNAQRTEIFELFPELRSASGLEGSAVPLSTSKRPETRLLTGR